MDPIAQLLLSSVIWGPLVVILYWVIRLAVRHGVQDGYRAAHIDEAVARRGEAIRRQDPTYGGSVPE